MIQAMTPELASIGLGLLVFAFVMAVTYALCRRDEE